MDEKKGGDGREKTGAQKIQERAPSLADQPYIYMDSDQEKSKSITSQQEQHLRVC